MSALILLSRNPVSRPIKLLAEKPLILALLAVAIFGAYTSFRYHFAVWGLDPDSTQVGTIWTGIRDNGYPFLKTYSFGPDNWLLSLILPLVPLLDLIGPRAMAIVGVGWIAFVGIAVMVGLISWVFAGPVIALAVSALILLSNAKTIGTYGFLSHPASHDITLAWGLTVFLLFYLWHLRGNRTAFALACAVLAMDCISDPWGIVGIATPCFGGALVCLISPIGRRRSAACVLGVIAALIVTQTKAFGILSFLISFPFAFGNWASINANFLRLTTSVGVIFNPIPGLQQPFPITVAFSCLCVLVSAIWGSYTLLRASMENAARLWLAVTITLSAALPCAAFVLTVLPAGSEAGRFADSLIVFVPAITLSALGIAIGRASPIVRFGIPVFFSLMVLASVYGGAPFWLSPWRGMATDPLVDSVGLARFLQQHELTYGYGEYWGASANCVTLIGAGKVTMRPVTFNPQTGFISRRGDSSLWYGPKSIPRNATRFFVAFMDDGENCRSMSICRNGVQQQFGPANETYTFGALTILAWNKPIIAQ
jgi:hypothetical protein